MATLRSLVHSPLDSPRALAAGSSQTLSRGFAQPTQCPSRPTRCVRSTRPSSTQPQRSTLCRSSGMLERNLRRGSSPPLRCSATSASAGIPDEQLKDAVKGGDMATVKAMLAGGQVDVNSASETRSGWTALHLACFYEHPDIVAALLDAGADTDARSNTGNTPLQFACLKGNVEIAKLLLAAGADLYATSDDKGNALEYAQEWGSQDMVDYLLIYAATDRRE